MIRPRPEWPNGTMCMVALTFDNLGESLDLLRYGHAGGALSDGVYAPRRGVDRVLELLACHGVSATFFVEGWGAQNYPEVVQDIVTAGHEVGAHGWMHETWSELGSREERELIARATDAITTAAGEPPRGWRAPSGLATPTMLEAVFDAGYEYDSSFADEDVPYRMHITAHREETLVELPWSWVNDDAAYYAFPRTLVRPSDVAQGWIEEFDAAYRYTGFFHLLCHPRFSGRPSRIEALDTLLRHMKSHDSVTFARCDQIAQIASATHETPIYQAPRVLD